jgi:hypothetical protein
MYQELWLVGTRHLLLAVGPALLGLPGCSTVTTGTNHSIAVTTVPAGATCNLTRDGEFLTVVQRTPGTATVSKSGHDIAVDCSAPGELTGAGVIPAGPQYATLGNIFVGGLIGYAIDLGSGAASEYPRGIRVWLDGPRDSPDALRRSANSYLQHRNGLR